MTPYYADYIYAKEISGPGYDEEAERAFGYVSPYTYIISCALVLRALPLSETWPTIRFGLEILRARI